MVARDDDRQEPEHDKDNPPELTEQRFAENLRMTRERKGISQVRLAQEMAARDWPWRQQTVTRVETGQRMVRLGEATAIAEILGISLDTLIEPTHEVQQVELLAEWIRQAMAAWQQIAEATVQLLRTRGSLRTYPAVADPEPGSSPRVLGTVKVAQAVSRLSPDSAVAHGIARLAARSERSVADLAGMPGTRSIVLGSYADTQLIAEALRDGEHVFVDLKALSQQDHQDVLNFVDGAISVRGGMLGDLPDGRVVVIPALEDEEAVQSIWGELNS